MNEHGFPAPGALPEDVAIEFVTHFDRLALYKEACSFAESLSERNLSSNMDVRAELIRKKQIKKQALLDRNYEKNVSVVQSRFPWLMDILESASSEKYLIAGDARTGYRVLFKEEDRLSVQTLAEERLQKIREEIENNIDDIYDYPAVCIVEFLHCDVILWLAEKTPRKHGILQEKVIYVIEPEPMIFEAVLHTHDLSDLLMKRRIVPFVGAEYDKQIKKWFEATIFVPEPMMLYTSLPDCNVLAETFRKSHLKRLRLTSKRKKACSKYYGGMQPDDLIRRFSAEPLNIMIITTRYSTFIQYCARDIADALERLGHKTHIHIEPDDISTMTGMSLLEDIDTLKPDFLFQIDHHRYEAPGVFPEKIPFVSWIQDEMDTMTSKDPAIFGPLDFIFAAMIGDLIGVGHRPEKIHLMPIPASEEKFYPMELTQNDMDLYGCDVAYVSNIVPWDGLFERNNKAFYFFQSAISRFIREYMERDMNAFVTVEDYVTVIDEIETLIGVNLVKNRKVYAAQMKIQGIGAYLNRALPMKWIADSGFDLHLYGNGWNSAPGLEKYDCGPLMHGEPLRKAYQAAKINISITVSVTMHQRVFECLLCGGFVLVKDFPPEKDKLSVHDFFEVGKEIDVFRTREEMIEKIQFYLTHEDERIAMAELGRRKVLENCTFMNYAKRLVDVVRAGMVEYATSLKQE